MEDSAGDLSSPKVEDLVEEAEKARKNAFATTADITVGAAILTDSGKIYAAPYFESVIEGLGTCAERNAVGSAIADGEYKFSAVVVTSSAEELVTPCGACRQILAEFAEVAQHDITVIMRGQNGKTRTESLDKMIPDSFGAEESGVDLSRYR